MSDDYEDEEFDEEAHWLSIEQDIPERRKVNPEDAAQNIVGAVVGNLEIAGVGHIKRAGQVVPMRQIPADFAGVTPDDLRAALDAEVPERAAMFAVDAQRIVARTVDELNALIVRHHGELQSAANLVIERLIHNMRNRP